MSLTASMWTSVSGLLAHGEKMNVVGNNISNVNTLAFKSQRMDFQDFVYQYIGTASGMGQVGRGTSIGIVMNDFSQGSQETTTSSTDISINGAGFFNVKPLNNDMNYYTRAGNFTFNKDGYLVDPHGYALQGWAISKDVATQYGSARSSSSIIGAGSPVDVKLDTFYCPPRHTTFMSVPVVLPSNLPEANDKSVSQTNEPFFAMLNNWNASQVPTVPPLGTSQYAGQTTMEVYDEGGNKHKLTIYFDRVTDQTGQTVNGTNSDSIWEYVITMDPSEDLRDFGSLYDPDGMTPTSPNVPDKLKGLLGAGTMLFSSTGALKDMTCFVPDKTWWAGAAGAETVNLSAWVEAPLSADGFPMIAPNFSGTAGLQSAYANGTKTNPAYVDYTQANPNAEGRLIGVDLGLRSKSNSWVFNGVAASGAGGLHSANDIMHNYSGGPNNQGALHGMDGMGELQTNSSVCEGTSFGPLPNQRQDGYGSGSLRYVNVDTNGVLSASYSNGVTLALYQITLYDFPSKQNLRREGGNLFTETRESGSPSGGAAGTGVFGTTQGYTLEQSNADLAREFVNMITTQRGFQANSKTITTVDTMLETVIGMKR